MKKQHLDIGIEKSHTQNLIQCVGEEEGILRTKTESITTSQSTPLAKQLAPVQSLIRPFTAPKELLS